MFADCNTSGEPIKVWIQEFNHMYPQKTKKRQRKYFADRINNTYVSSIEEHLIHNCPSSYSANLFTILSNSNSDYHLEVLETIHILTHKRMDLYRSSNFWKAPWMSFCESVSMTFVKASFISSIVS